MLEQALLNTVVITFIHNQYAIAFFLGVVISIGLLIYNPSRYAALLLVGFIMLSIGFQYEKHIVGPLQEQTLESLQIDQIGGSSKLYILRVFQKLMPLIFSFLGWGSIFLAMMIGNLKKKSNNNLI